MKFMAPEFIRSSDQSPPLLQLKPESSGDNRRHKRTGQNNIALLMAARLQYEKP
jgi:hypothetical protein